MSPLHAVARMLQSAARALSTSSRVHAESRSTLRAVRGTHDYFPEEADARAQIAEEFVNVVRTYGYGQVEAPILEQSDLFSRGLGTSSDVVSKEMFSFTPQQALRAKDEAAAPPSAARGTLGSASRDGSASTEENLTLRPEGTAGILRAAIQSGLLPRHSPATSGPGTVASPSAPLRLYYQGPMFRYERPQRGRHRQFTQLGIERIGGGTSAGSVLAADVEGVMSAAQVLARVLPLHAGPLPPPLTLRLLVNSLGTDTDRTSYTAALRAYLTEQAGRGRLSADSVARLQRGAVLRILDSKAQEDAEALAGAPSITDHWSIDTRAAFEGVCSAVRDIGLPEGISILEEPRLVRGLDYYSGLIFEFVAADGSSPGAGAGVGQLGTVLAGGRYDALPRLLGYTSSACPCIGWAAGLDRLALLSALPPHLRPDARVPHVALLPVLHKNGDDGSDGGVQDAAMAVSHALRNRLQPQPHSHSVLHSSPRAVPIKVVVGELGVPLKRSLASAQSAGALVAIIMGATEVQAGHVLMKHLGTGHQEVVAVGMGTGAGRVDVDALVVAIRAQL